MLTKIAAAKTIEYPESDGLPMADNTLQYKWIVLICEGIVCVHRNVPDVFVAADLLWYPVESDPLTSIAPDVFVVFGRPRGERGSYKQWVEGGVAPQVAFEIISPNNTPAEMLKKLRFYEKYGVEEYYTYDPATNELHGWIRRDGRLFKIRRINGWTSPRLGVRFELTAETLILYGPDGRPFQSLVEVTIERDAERTRAEAEARRAAEESARADRLAAMLRARGIDPEA